MKNKIQNDINLLTPNFKAKVILFLAEAKKEWLDVIVWETKRTLARQKELYAQWRTTPWNIVTWTLQSKHLTWEAIDIIFDKDPDPKKVIPVWSWDYEKLIEIWKKYWMVSLYPKETCHFQDNWIPYTKYLITEIMKTDYKKIMNDVLNETWIAPILTSHEWDSQLNEWDIKCLLEIVATRIQERQNKMLSNMIDAVSLLINKKK